MSSLSPAKTEASASLPKKREAAPQSKYFASSPGYGAILSLQRTAGNRVVNEWLHSDSKTRSGVHLNPAPMMIQTKPANGQTSDTAGAATQSPSLTASSNPLLVEDEAAELQPGQMRKSDFLSQL